MEKTMQKIELKKYDNYKDSGVEWLGEIPERWGILAAKRYHNVYKLLNKDHICDNVLSLTLRGVVNNNLDKPEGLVPKDYGTYQLFNKNDLVFKLIDLENVSTSRVGLVHEKGIMSSAYIRLVTGIETYPKYAYYYYYSLYKNEVYNKIGSGVRSTLGPNDLLNLPFLKPSHEEQTAIANFLDEKCSKIDQAIAQKQKLILLLKERKQILIQNAVTKGVGSLSGVEVKMKDSGVEWIGEIPESWEKTPLRHLLKKIQQGNSPSPTNGYSTTHVIKLSAIKKGNFYKKELKPIQNQSFENRYQLKKGDFLMTRGNTPELVADTCIIREDIKDLIMYSDLVFKLTFHTSKVDAHFILNCMQSSYLRNQITMSARGSNTTMIKVSQDQFKSWIFFIPCLKEQKEISNYIETQTNKIDKSITLQQQQIEKLKEYKSSLINSAVTGKIKVY